MRRLAPLAATTAAAALLVAVPAPALAHGPSPRAAVLGVERTFGAAAPAATRTVARPATIAVVGVVTAVVAPSPSTATITVAVKGGDKTLRGRTVAVLVDDRADVRRNHRRVAAAALRVGDKLAVRAIRDGDTLSALRVVAVGRRKAATRAQPS